MNKASLPLLTFQVGKSLFENSQEPMVFTYPPPSQEQFMLSPNPSGLQISLHTYCSKEVCFKERSPGGTSLRNSEQERKLN